MFELRLLNVPDDEWSETLEKLGVVEPARPGALAYVDDSGQVVVLDPRLKRLDAQVTRSVRSMVEAEQAEVP